MKRCAAGQYSPVGATACTQCPVGHKCPNNAVTLLHEKKACSDATYLLTSPSGALTIQECAEACLTTATCAEIAVQRGTLAGICKAYKAGCPYAVDAEYDVYEVSSASTAQLSYTSAPIKCPAGYFQSLPGKTTCTICPKGHFCEEASSYPKKCSFGHYAPEAGAGACEQCQAGFACPSADSWPVPCG